jgi:hypothetical protein
LITMTPNIAEGTEPLSDSPKSAPLDVLWSATISQVYGCFPKHVTKKYLGQLNLFRRVVGEQAPEVMVHAIRNWAKFADKTDICLGIPERPTIRFLLEHHTIAVNLYLESKRKSKPTSLVNEPKPEPRPKATEPIKLTFSPEQRAILRHMKGDERYRKFMRAIIEKYGENSIICGGFPPGGVPCDIAVSELAMDPVA